MLVARVASVVIWIRGHRPRCARPPRIPIVCRRHPLRGGFLRNPNKLPLAPCSNLFRILLSQASLDEVGERDFSVIPIVCHGHPVQIFLFSTSLEQVQIRLFIKIFCGERGIRTPETLLEFTRFPGVPLQPLEHLSFWHTTPFDPQRYKKYLIYTQ